MYTDDKLRKAVLELLKETPADKITIKSVCEYAGVSRPSFYYHFNNMAELVWSCFAKMQNSVIDNPSTDPSDWLDHFSIISAFLRQHRNALKNVYNSKLFGSVMTLMANENEQAMNKVIHEIVDKYDLDLTEEQQVFFASFYRAVHVSMVLRFVEDDSLMQPEMFKEALRSLPKDPIMLAVSKKIEQSGDF